MKKQHIFKKRIYILPDYIPKINWGSVAYLSLTQQRFDYIFMRTIKKLFKRRFLRKKVFIYQPKFLIYLNINLILTMKSKNARMGAGVGNFVRLSMQLFPKNCLMEFKKYGYKHLLKAVQFLFHKCSLRLVAIKKFGRKYGFVNDFKCNFLFFYILITNIFSKIFLFK